MGRLSDGACLRAGLDALHRADPRRNPGGCGVGSDSHPRRRHARDLFAWSGYSIRRGGVCDRAIRRLPRPVSRLSRTCREGDGRIADHHRNSLPDRRGRQCEFLVAGYLSLAGEDRITSMIRKSGCRFSEKIMLN